MPNPASVPARIAYLLQMADLSTENGISKKIIQQAEAWQKAGALVKLFTQSDQAQTWRDFPHIPIAVFSRGRSWQRYRQSRALAAAIRNWQPDVIYFRYAYHAPGLPALFRSFPTIAEINSDDQKEYPLTLGPLKNLYHRLTRLRVLSPIAGFTPVTHALADLAVAFDRPVKVIANAIRLDAFPELTPAPITPPLRLVFVGSPRTPWHGLDRIAALALLLPDWEFDIIGDDTSTWQESVPSPPPTNVHLHGPLPLDLYLPFLSAATAALGTLGLYRKRMDEACPLKVREYLALGLPVIAGYEDTDIPPNADYYLRLPNNAAPLDSHLPQITAFLKHWQNRRVPRTSVAHLDTSIKETHRLAFMSQIAATHASSL